jgi:type IV secretion system protein VirD4
MTIQLPYLSTKSIQFFKVTIMENLINKFASNLMMTNNLIQEVPHFLDSNHFGNAPDFMYDSSGIFLGASQNGHKLYQNSDGNILTFGPPGSGKFISSLANAVIEHENSSVIIDIKGEAAHVLAETKSEEGFDVAVCDPCNISNTRLNYLKTGFNPLDICFTKTGDISLNIANKADTIADAIVIPKSNDAYWDNSAKNLISALIVHVVLTRPNPSLIDVMNIINETFKSKDQTLMEMSQSRSPIVRQKISPFLAKNQTNSSVFTVAMNHLSFLCDHQIANSLTTSGIDFSTLNKNKTVVFLVIPPHYVETCKPWLRLALNCAFSEIIENSAVYNYPVLFMLDEAYNLGYLSQLPQMLSLGRGYGIKIWTYWQDISQLRHLYGEMAHTFFANSGVLQFFTPHDIETARVISDRCLTKSMMTPTFSFTRNGIRNDFELSNISLNEAQISLMSLNEVFGLPKDKQILFVSGIANPIIADKCYYYEEYPSLPTSQFFRV